MLQNVALQWDRRDHGNRQCESPGFCRFKLEAVEMVTRQIQYLRKLSLNVTPFLGGLALVVLGAAVPMHCRARAVQVAEVSTGLAFSESEVSAYAAEARNKFLDRMSAWRVKTCPQDCERVRGVWARLQPVLRAQQPGNPPTLQLELINSPDVDALSFADGTIFISTAFLKRSDLDDSQIAFVLAHEASHILMQHERQTLTSAMALMAPTQLQSAADIYAEIAERFFTLDDALTLIAHQTEFEADEVGLEIAALAGFNPHAQLAFMRSLAVKGEAESMVSTHPRATLRLEKLQARLPLVTRLYAAGVNDSSK